MKLFAHGFFVDLSVDLHAMDGFAGEKDIEFAKKSGGHLAFGGIEECAELVLGFGGINGEELLLDAIGSIGAWAFLEDIAEGLAKNRKRSRKVRLFGRDGFEQGDELESQFDDQAGGCGFHQIMRFLGGFDDIFHLFVHGVHRIKQEKQARVALKAQKIQRLSLASERTTRACGEGVGDIFGGYLDDRRIAIEAFHQRKKFLLNFKEIHLPIKGDHIKDDAQAGLCKERKDGLKAQLLGVGLLEGVVFVKPQQLFGEEAIDAESDAVAIAVSVALPDLGESGDRVVEAIDTRREKDRHGVSRECIDQGGCAGGMGRELWRSDIQALDTEITQVVNFLSDQSGIFVDRSCGEIGTKRTSRPTTCRPFDAGFVLKHRKSVVSGVVLEIKRHRRKSLDAGDTVLIEDLRAQRDEL